MAQVQLKDRLIRPARKRLRYELARAYRSLLGKTCFVGVTGSCGKTTTTELIAGILAGKGKVGKRSHENTSEHLAEMILGLSKHHRYCVCELAGGGPGLLRNSTRLLKPRIGVVTNVGNDHLSYYRNLDATAAEKGMLVEALPVDGTAVLNADDDRVIAMRYRTKARVITYGLSDEAMVRGAMVSCAWPQRLSMDITFGKVTRHVRTRLLGEHWASAVLAAIAAAIAAGVEFESAVEAIETVEPIPYRMCPHQTPDGVTFISDNGKSSMGTVLASLDFMKKAKAARRVFVMGSVADSPGSFFRRYKQVNRQSLGIADKTIFCGEHALAALRSRPNIDDESIMAFETIYELNSFLQDYLRAGDLVMLKGVENVDHIQRVVLSRTKGVACWQQRCHKNRFCDNCRLLHTPSMPAATGSGMATSVEP